MNVEQHTWIWLVTNYLTFVVVCCITASGFKVMLFSRLVEKAWIQFDSCKKNIYIPPRCGAAKSERKKLLFTNTQLGQRQTEHSLIWAHIWDLRLCGFGPVDIPLTFTTTQASFFILITYLQ